jgi:hypothetical protein
MIAPNLPHASIGSCQPPKPSLSDFTSKHPLRSSRAKQERTCEMLRSSLPKYDEMMEILTARGSWWEYWRQKTYGKTKAVETLPQYASRIFTNGSPMELGLLVSAFGLSAKKNGGNYLALVNQLIISDIEYTTTLPGLECIVLQAKCYLDIGQPRRSWLTYRRGLDVAQLVVNASKPVINSALTVYIQNLHRTHQNSLEAGSIWWTLYQGDRFLSLLLGLPYSVNDVQCQPSHENHTNGAGMSVQPFSLQCGKIAGTLIDRNQSGKEDSISKAMQIDDEMEKLAASMPQNWWEVASLMTDSSISTIEVRQRILLQLFFLLIRAYLHLPFLLMRQPPPGFGYCEHSRMACVDSARMMVQRYHMLRFDFDGQALYDCKTNDFVGFIASVILLVGTSRSGGPQASKRTAEDSSLIDASVSMFKRLSESEPCRLFSQCHHALDTLKGKHGHNINPIDSSPSVKIFIPYFGTVSIKPSSNTSAIPNPENRDLTTPSPLNTSFNEEATTRLHFEATTLRAGEFHEFSANTFSFDSEIQGAFTDDGFTWLDDDVPLLDIDQDWSWMEQH